MESAKVTADDTAVRIKREDPSFDPPLFSKGATAEEIFEWCKQPQDGEGPADNPLFGDRKMNHNAAAVNSRDYRSMFYNDRKASLENGGFESFSVFLRAVHFDSPELRAMGENVPADGGFLVPTEFAAFMLDASLENELIRPGATVWPMKSDSLKIPGWDGADHSSNLFGGFQGEWLGESSTGTKRKAKVRQIQLTARKLACYTNASNELIADGINFEMNLQEALIKTLGWYLDDAFINGDGAGKPLGILNDPALITIAKETGQAASTLVYENVAKMFARIHPASVQRAVWICNPTIIPQLLELSIPVGTGGSIVPVFNQESGVFRMLTRPVLFTEKCPALGSKGDIMLVDRSQYQIGLRKEIALDKSNAPGWTEDETDYRAILRADGQGAWSEAVTPKNGNSLSWCITLAART